jgi:hypothetical protein
MGAVECENCRFWERPYIRINPHIGRCKRNAPRPMSHYQITAFAGDDPEGDRSAEELGLYVYWPVTSSDDWCGEFSEIKT